MRHFPLPDATAVLRALPELAPRLPLPEPLRRTLRILLAA